MPSELIVPGTVNVPFEPNVQYSVEVLVLEYRYTSLPLYLSIVLLVLANRDAEFASDNAVLASAKALFDFVNASETPALDAPENCEVPATVV